MTGAGSGPVIAVVGSTGAAGTTVLRILEERRFPHSELRLLASSRGAGTATVFAGREIRVAEVSEQALAGVDIGFFAAGAAVARRFAPVLAAGGGVAIDKSSAYRMDPAVPLIVPEVNGADVDRHQGIVANPNCVAIPLAVVLAPLSCEFALHHVTVATYQSASGGGRALVAELGAQLLADSRGEIPAHHVYPHVLHGNVVPGGWPMFGEDTEEEVKVVAETRRVLDLPELAMSVTTVRVPVTVGHSAAIWIEFAGPVSASAVRTVLERAAGVRVIDDPGRHAYPTPRGVAGTDDVQVGRIRADHGRPGGVALFLAVDNLRKGAATNAVQVAELLSTRLANLI